MKSGCDIFILIVLFWRTGFQHGGRSAVGAEAGGLGCGEGVSPSPLGEGSGDGAMPLTRIFFYYFWLKILYFDAFWHTNYLVNHVVAVQSTQMQE